MKLENKKAFASRTLGVGKGRIVFNKNRLDEIKQAITKQDILDLKNAGSILIKEKSGRKKVEKRKSRRRAGSIKKKVKRGKKTYVLRTRKLRAYLSMLKEKGKLPRENYYTLRKEIKASSFRNLSHIKERIASMEKEK